MAGIGISELLVIIVIALLLWIWWKGVATIWKKPAKKSVEENRTLSQKEAIKDS
ncbi:MAG: hypothetical protein Q6362_012440 [Candidatus Wukongarchaeota archaeon]|nr:hypothetical protein [Candidatus Wukongarchaeota archaeon]MDO8130218.1 hypothetical protein [Candidatus Wukongarchaeota archaeon]